MLCFVQNISLAPTTLTDACSLAIYIPNQLPRSFVPAVPYAEQEHSGIQASPSVGDEGGWSINISLHFCPATEVAVGCFSLALVLLKLISLTTLNKVFLEQELSRNDSKEVFLLKHVGSAAPSSVLPFEQPWTSHKVSERCLG